MITIYSTIVGSKLYGIDNPESDTDIKGVCLPPIRSICGFNGFEQEDRKNGLQGKDKVESTIYSLHKFLNLVRKGNPTVLELAFADPKFHQISTPLGLSVCKFVRENMISKHIFPAYQGYFHSQLKKLQNKEYDPFSMRQVYVKKYGFDTKFAAHAYRLGIQLCELLKWGPELFNPTMKVDDGCDSGWVCKGIKEGYYSYDQVLGFLTHISEKSIPHCLDNSVLPDKIDQDKVENFLVRIYSDYIRCPDAIENQYYD